MALAHQKAALLSGVFGHRGVKWESGSDILTHLPTHVQSSPPEDTYWGCWGRHKVAREVAVADQFWVAVWNWELVFDICLWRAPAVWLNKDRWKNMLYLSLCISLPQKPKLETDANKATTTCLKSKKKNY